MIIEYAGRTYETVEQPRFVKDWDYNVGCWVAWYEAIAISNGATYLIHWDLDVVDMADCDEENPPFSECCPEPMDVVAWEV